MNNKIIKGAGTLSNLPAGFTGWEKIIKNGWEIMPSGYKTGLFGLRQYMEEEDSPLINKEREIIYNMLKLFIPGEYGYYFIETHEHDEPEDIPEYAKGVWERVYYTPMPFYYESGEYNSIDVAYSRSKTEDYTYYAISLHGCSFASALTEYVRVAK